MRQNTAIEMAVGTVSTFNCRNIFAYISPLRIDPTFVWAECQ